MDTERPHTPGAASVGSLLKGSTASHSHFRHCSLSPVYIDGSRADESEGGYYSASTAATMRFLAFNSIVVFQPSSLDMESNSATALENAS